MQRTVELLDPQEQWVQRLLAARQDLTFADVVRWAVDQARPSVPAGQEDAALTEVAASIPHRAWKPGPPPGRASRWPRLKTCVGCGVRSDRVRPCCDHDDAKPVCDPCYKNDKGNHGEHGSNRRED